jgi:hypothetical protein
LVYNGRGGTAFIPWVGLFTGLPVFLTSLLLQNIQKVTATGDAIILNYQDMNRVNKSDFTEIELEKSSIQSQESRQSHESNSVPQLSEATIIQQTLNRLPAVPIAGKNLKFEFVGDAWFAKVNGENFLAGKCIFENDGNGYNLTLQTTNVWSGAVEEVIDLLQKVGVPLGPAAGPLRTAARVASRFAKWIPLEASAIILKYVEGPPANISFVKMEK